MLTYTLEKRKAEPIQPAVWLYPGDIPVRRPAAPERLSKRTLAQHLEVSTITVKNAYEQLQAEGYMHTVEKLGSLCRRWSGPAAGGPAAADTGKGSRGGFWTSPPGPWIRRTSPLPFGPR